MPPEVRFIKGFPTVHTGTLTEARHGDYKPTIIVNYGHYNLASRAVLLLRRREPPRRRIFPAHSILIVIEITFARLRLPTQPVEIKKFHIPGSGYNAGVIAVVAEDIITGIPQMTPEPT
jgi:hypothetical protein